MNLFIGFASQSVCFRIVGMSNIVNTEHSQRSAIDHTAAWKIKTVSTKVYNSYTQKHFLICLKLTTYDAICIFRTKHNKRVSPLTNMD